MPGVLEEQEVLLKLTGIVDKLAGQVIMVGFFGVGQICFPGVTEKQTSTGC